MSIFGASSSVNQDIEKATSENSTTENWGLILDICDRVNNLLVTPKECLKCIIKRLNSPNPHVVMKAITLLDACVNNCGKQFHLEVASREFETEFKKLLQKSQPKVTTKLKLTLKQWAEKVFKSDPQLDLIPSLYKKLREEGHDFSDPSVTPKRETTLSKDPNVVSSQQEEDDIAKAIELSLKEVKISQSPKMMSSSGTTSTSLYPSALLTAAPVPEPRKVRALYDFEAAEDNELTFQAGEIIMVLDDSDPNWWKGQNQRGEGLFPSNFVTADLSVEPETLNTAAQGAKKTVQFSDEQQKGDSEKELQDKLLQASSTVEINEEKINRLLHLIHEADPEDPSQDTEEMLQLEQLVNQMGPMIDAELERVDRKHAQLTQLSSDLVDAINLYHNLMREPDRSTMMSMGGMAPMTHFPPGAYIPQGGYPAGGPASMGPSYGMPGMYGTMPDGGMYPMGPGQQGGPATAMDGSGGMQRYNRTHNHFDPAAAAAAAAMSDHTGGTAQSHQTMHHLPQQPHHHPQQQQPPPPQPSQQIPLPVVSQNGPMSNGMASQVAPAMSLGAGVTSQQVPPQSSNTTNPQAMSQPNMTVPQMAYNNPTSPPPAGLAGPQAQAFRQMRPMGQQQQPPVSYANYGPQQPAQQQQQQPPVPQLGQHQPQGGPQGPPQHHVPVSGAAGGPPTTLPSAANMNQHPHHQQQQQPQQHLPISMPPAHFPPTTAAPPSQMAAPHHHHLQQQQQQQPQTHFMPQMGGPASNFPMGPMSMFPPGVVGPNGVAAAGPLSINTNHPGPQNIPIYQQQR